MLKQVKNKIITGLLVATTGICTAPVYAQEIGPAYRDIDQIHLVDSDTAVIDARGRKYSVIFRNVCQVGSFGEFFVLDRFQLGQHVSPGDVFQSSGSAAPCTVESISEMPSVMQLGEDD